MGENYAGSQYIAYTTKIRAVLKELPSFAGDFFRGIENDTLVRTRYAYAVDMRTFFKYLVLQPEFSDKAITELTLADLDRVTTSTVEDFLSYVSYYTDDGDHEQINGERAKARKLSTLRAFYKYFYRKERIKNNPPSLVDQPSIHDKSIIRLEPDEVARLLDAVQSGEGLTEKEKQYHKRTQARDLAILTLFLGTGIRISELVGINTLIQSRSGTYIGYAFAVPTSIVKKVVVDLKEHGVVQRAMLGIQYIPLTEEFLETEEGKKTGIQEPGGIYVAEVDPEGAAHAAGIRSGDVIVEINGIKIDGSAQLSEEIAKHRPNDKVTVGVKKGSDVKQIEVVLRNKAGNTEVITKDIVSAYDALGGQFAEVSERTKKALKIGGGVQVVGIEPGGILESARIRKGYIITNINDRPVRSIGDLNRITSKIEYIEGVYPDGRVVAYSPTVK